MITRSRPLTNALTRRRSNNRGLDPKHVLLVAIFLILGLYQVIHSIFLSTSPEPSVPLLNLDTFNSAGANPPGSAATELDSEGESLRQKRISFESDLDPSLPKWIRDYIAWHREVRATYPGDELFTNPEAPNVLIRTCLGLCGGLHDRLGQLPWDLYLANQTGRVLFLRWYRPKPIEDFLIPNGFNWSMPPNLPGFSRLQEVKHTITELFDGTDDSHPEEDFWTTHLDAGIQRAKHGDFQKVKILRHRILGHLNEDELERRLQALGEKDMIHSTKTFGKLFFLFFHPAPPIEMELEDVYTALNIAPKKYSAVHCRVRHPKAFSKKVGV